MFFEISQFTILVQVMQILSRICSTVKQKHREVRKIRLFDYLKYSLSWLACICYVVGQ